MYQPAPFIALGKLFDKFSSAISAFLFSVGDLFLPPPLCLEVFQAASVDGEAAIFFCAEAGRVFFVQPFSQAVVAYAKVCGKLFSLVGWVVSELPHDGSEFVWLEFFIHYAASIPSTSYLIATLAMIELLLLPSSTLQPSGMAAPTFIVAV